MIEYILNKIFKKKYICDYCRNFMSHEQCINACSTYPRDNDVGYCIKGQGLFEPVSKNEKICKRFKKSKMKD